MSARRAAGGMLVAVVLLAPSAAFGDPPDGAPVGGPCRYVGPHDESLGIGTRHGVLEGAVTCSIRVSDGSSNSVVVTAPRDHLPPPLYPVECLLTCQWNTTEPWLCRFVGTFYWYDVGEVFAVDRTGDVHVAGDLLWDCPPYADPPQK